MLQLRLWTHRADAIYFCIYPNLMKVFSSNSPWLDQSVAALDTSRDIQPGCVGCVNCQCTNHKGIEATSSERRKHFLNSFYNEVKSFLIMSFATSQNQFLTQLKCIDLGHLVLRTTSRYWYPTTRRYVYLHAVFREIGSRFPILKKMEDGKPITITGMITIFNIPISFVEHIKRNKVKRSSHFYLFWYVFQCIILEFDTV